VGNNTGWSCVIPPRIKKSKSCVTTNHKKKNRRFQLKKIPTSSNQNNNEAGEIFTPDLHFCRISTANQEIEPAKSIEENTNFNVRLNSTKLWSKWKICCEICTHDLHFCRISTANQEIEPAISSEENTNFNVRLNSTKL